MASLIETIRGKPSTKAQSPTAPAIEARLRAAESQMAALEAALTEAAMAASADPGSRAAYDSALAKVMAAHADIDLLNRAYEGALAQDNAAAIARRADLRREGIAAIKRHVKSRNDALAEMAEALDTAAKAFARALEKCEQAYACRPDDFRWPDTGTLISFGELRQLWMAHLYKVSAKPGGEGALPGSSAPDVNFVWQPNAIRSIADETQLATDQLFAMLDKRAD
jgi:hypothetical protein